VNEKNKLSVKADRSPISRRHTATPQIMPGLVMLSFTVFFDYVKIRLADSGVLSVREQFGVRPIQDSVLGPIVNYPQEPNRSIVSVVALTGWMKFDIM
jgi:hypothetical protein